MNRACASRRWRRPRHAPSMVLRVFLLLSLGLCLAAALTGGMAWWRAREGGTWGPPAPQDWAERVATYVRAIESVPPPQRAAVAALGESAGLQLSIPAAAADPMAVAAAADASDEPALSAALSAALGRPARVVDASGVAACAGDARAGGGWSGWRGPGSWYCRQVRTTFADGTPLRLRVSPTFGWRAAQAAGGEHRLAWLWPLALPLVLLALAAGITRLALAPLLTLSRAAERFADDVDAPPLPERGPREIRAALAVFNRMQSRIRAHMSERTSMLAAIAHDLQTPLTRLRLRLEQVADPALRDSLERDLAECRSRVREGLDLARSLDDRSPLVALDLDALLRSACDQAADAGLPVHYEGDSRLTVRARPAALLRCVENLIANAVKYGDAARVGAAAEGADAVIRVRDRGPGIVPQDLERVFEPFVRLEHSRSRDTGGTGLGLTIARNLMSRQGGSVELRNIGGTPPQGLEARLRIPLAG